MRMCCVYALTPSLLVKLTVSVCTILVPPPEPSGSFAEALHLFDQFIQESDLDAAQRCVDILVYAGRFSHRRFCALQRLR
jgi:hypothetical protein